MLCSCVRRYSIRVLFVASSQVTALSTRFLQHRSSWQKTVFSRNDSAGSGYDTSNENAQGASGGSDGGINLATRDQIIIGIVIAVVGVLSSKNQITICSPHCVLIPYADIVDSIISRSDLHSEEKTLGRNRKESRTGQRILYPSSLSISRTTTTSPTIIRYGININTSTRLPRFTTL